MVPAALRKGLLWILLSHVSDSLGKRHECFKYLSDDAVYCTFRHAYLGLPTAADADRYLIPVCHRRNCQQSNRLEMLLTCHVPFSSQSLAYYAFPLGTGKQSGRWLSAVWTVILYLWNRKAALFHFICCILWSEPILLCCCMADRSHHNSDAGIVPFICTQNKDYKIYYNCNFDFYCIYHSRHSFLSR